MRCCLLLLALLTGCAPTTVYPGLSWERTTPASQGVDGDTLRAALDFLAGHCGENGLDEVLVIRRGRVLWAGDSTGRVHDIWSCTKSFTSTIVGQLAANKSLSLDQPLADFLPELRPQYPGATFRHFLTMTSGYDALGGTRWPGDTSRDWSATPYLPTTPLFPPGSAYAYWDEAMIMLGRAVTQGQGKSLATLLQEGFGDRIGLPRREWWGEGQTEAGVKINFGGTGLKLSAEEHARFGLLLLNDGVWEGERLLPAGWAAEAMRNQVPESLTLAATDRRGTDGRGRYGYNWWVIQRGRDAPVDAAFTSGLNHNVCLVVPAWDMVIVRQGTDGNPAAGKHEVYSEFLRRLAPGVGR